VGRDVVTIAAVILETAGARRLTQQEIPRLG
jgi:hypothetical protein